MIRWISAATSFGVSTTDDDVFVVITELMGSVGTYHYGRRMYEIMAVWETDATLATRSDLTADYAKGSSGSPLFNEKGNVACMVATTHSIYYDVKNNVERNLQMVVKSCVPAESVLKLIKQ